jgi:hypothetical protein
MEVAFHGTVERPTFLMALRNDVRHTIFATSTDLQGQDTGTYQAGETAVIKVEAQNWLVPGRYELTPSVSRDPGGEDPLDLREDLADVMIHGSKQSGAVVEIPHTIDLERR